MKQVSLIIIGAGDRGQVYAGYAKKYSDLVRIIGVAEPRDYYRRKLAEEHDIPSENVLKDWKSIVERERFADAAIVATPDSLHAEPAIALASKGYHLLLEKPMAPDEESCRRIVKAARESEIIFSVGHVLRYTKYTQKLKNLIDNSVIGEVVSIQHLEPVGYWHQAHSFVRGNWRREDQSSFMLLAKSCHDIDWIRYIMGKRCTSVSSFGSLVHFRKENMPPTAGSNCLHCDYEPECPYSAKKIYFGFFSRGIKDWPVNVVTPEPSEETLTEAILTGPYGRCVYRCDNDVVDQQVVNMEFEGGATASFSMMAFTKARHRETRIFGTRGEIYGDGVRIHVTDFLTDETTTYDTATNASVLEGHGGGDYWIMHSFIDAVKTGDPSLILSGPAETLETHLMTFAAEKSRREKRTVFMSDYF
ncbi:MAG: Gfo/Idh/MocA family protein [Candidatus Thorarchaeota archaeon]